MVHIALEAEFPNSPEAVQLGEMLGDRRAWAHVVILWCDQMLANNEAGVLKFPDWKISELALWKGDPTEFVEALKSEGVALLREKKGGLYMSGWSRNRRYFKEKRRMRDKQKRYRERMRKGRNGDGNVTGNVTGDVTVMSRVSPSPSPSPSPSQVVATALTGDPKIWNRGDPIEAPYDLVALSAQSGGPVAAGLSGKARGLASQILSSGPVESWEYEEAIQEIDRQGKGINAGLIAAVILRRRKDAASASNGAAPPARSKPQPGRGWEPYRDPCEDEAEP